MVLPSGIDSPTASVSNLSLHALRVELHRRKLSTAGLRQTLQRRLEQHLRDVLIERRSQRSHLPSFITVPTTFGSNYESVPYSTRAPISSETDTLVQQSYVTGHRLPTANIKQKSPCTVTKCEGDPLLSNETDFHNGNGQVVGDPDRNKVNTGNSRNTDGASPDSPSPSVNGIASQRPETVPGVLRIRSIWVCGERNMRMLWEGTGPIGKASLSRSAPSYSTPEADRLRGRALRQLLELEGQSIDSSRLGVEHLQLTLVEAYYAAFVLKKLIIHNQSCGSNSVLSSVAAWRLFCTRGGRTFAPTFVAYCRYRAAGWLPRSGLKYGADWVLYPASTQRHTHSPFCVILRFNFSNEPCKLDRTWVALQNRLRLTKNVAKTLVIAEITCSSDVRVALDVRNAFKNVAITELTVDRWVP